MEEVRIATAIGVAQDMDAWVEGGLRLGPYPVLKFVYALIGPEKDFCETKLRKSKQRDTEASEKAENHRQTGPSRPTPRYVRARQTRRMSGCEAREAPPARRASPWVAEKTWT